MRPRKQRAPNLHISDDIHVCVLHAHKVRSILEAAIISSHMHRSIHDLCAARMYTTPRPVILAERTSATATAKARATAKAIATATATSTDTASDSHHHSHCHGHSYSCTIGAHPCALRGSTADCVRKNLFLRRSLFTRQRPSTGKNMALGHLAFYSVTFGQN